MASVSVTDDLLTVDVQGLHRLWAFKRRIRVPLAHVRGATPDPGIVHEPKGLRAPGLHVPGAAVIGTFHCDGEKHFWDVRVGTHTIVIELADRPTTDSLSTSRTPAPQWTPSTARYPTSNAERPKPPVPLR